VFPLIRGDSDGATLPAREPKEAVMSAKLQRIVIAVGDGVESDAALDQGLQIAADEKAFVDFVHVAPILGEQFAPAAKETEDVPGTVDAAVLDRACADADELGIRCDRRLLIGYPPRQIALLADEVDADLIVVGSRGHGAMKRTFLGSTSRALLNETKRAVLVVQETP
jgi:nucleotide-binding universal stress UspA family protein